MSKSDIMPENYGFVPEEDDVELTDEVKVSLDNNVSIEKKEVKKQKQKQKYNAEQCKKYYENNKEKVLQQKKEYYINNREVLKQRNIKKYYETIGREYVAKLYVVKRNGITITFNNIKQIAAFLDLPYTQVWKHAHGENKYKNLEINIVEK